MILTLQKEASNQEENEILQRDTMGYAHSVPRESGVRKTVYTLNVDGYSREITDITYPLLSAYAEKIGAEFCVISERKFPGWPPVYEKLQIHELAQDRGDDWSIYIDSDALVHPDLFDITEHLSKDMVLHNGSDLAGNRWVYDKYFRRDGRHIGSCNWFTIASNWCLDLWKPLDDLTLEEAVANIRPTAFERARYEPERDDHGKPVVTPRGHVEMVEKAVITAEHLIDDYTLSRNIARHGLHFVTFMSLLQQLGRGSDDYLWHAYTLKTPQKVEQMKLKLRQWNLA